MSYIQPNSKIWLLKNVQLKPDYEHTILFSSTTIQLNYFIQGGENPRFSPMGFDSQSYQRVGANIIRLSLNADIAVMQGYNYLVFRNDEYTRNPEYTPVLAYKYYYAFITEITYVNNNVCEIHYMIDVMQSFMFDYTMRPCLVLREHTESDNIGEHTVPEPVEAGKYVYSAPSVLEKQENERYEYIQTETPFLVKDYPWYIMVAATFTFTNRVDGEVIKNFPPQFEQFIPSNPWQGTLYNGLFYTILETTGEVNTFLHNAVDVINGDYSAGIVGIFMIPSSHIVLNNSGTHDYPIHKTIDKAIRVFDNWTIGSHGAPKNNKLYTFPYTYLQITSPDGNMMQIEQEDFNVNFNSSDEKCKSILFSESFVLSACPQLDIAPGTRTSEFLLYDGIGKKYKGSEFNNAFRLTLSNFPMCSYATDAYAAWLAQNQAKNQIVISHETELLKRQEYSTINNAYQETVNNVMGGISGGTSIMASALSKIPAIGQITGVANIGKSVLSEFSTLNRLINDSLTHLENFRYQHRMLNEEIRLASNLPDIPHAMDANSLDVSINNFCFRFQWARVDNEYACVVDDFFTRYGYAVQTFKVPTRNNRPHFTFVQTKRAVATGPITHNYLSEICACYDAGITFWKYDADNPDTFFMNYDVDNRPEKATPQDYSMTLVSQSGNSIVTNNRLEIQVNQPL